MIVEIPKIVQQIGSGTASSMFPVVGETTGVLVRTTGALWTFGWGAVINGCVLVIFTVGARGGAGSGKMLIRAVSFFGPLCVVEPG